MALLCSWSRHVRDVGCGVWRVTAQRVLIYSANLYIRFALRSRQQRRGSVDVRTISGVCVDGRPTYDNGTGIELSRQCKLSAARGAAACQSTPAGLGLNSCRTSSPTLRETGRAGGSYSAATAAVSVSGHCVDAEFAASGGDLGGHRVRTGRNDSTSTVACGGGNSGSSWAVSSGSGSSAGLTCPQTRPPAYRPFIRRSTQVLKLPGYSPEQLGPGWEARLRDTLAARGQHLASAYVRAGCIELLLELTGASGGGESGGSGGGGGGSSGLEDSLQDPAFIAELCEILGLPLSAEYGAGGGVRVLGVLRGGFPAALASSLANGAAAPQQEQQQSSLLAVSLRPRVALLPPAKGCSSSGVLTLELEAAGLPAAAIEVVHEGEAQEDGAAAAGPAPGPPVELLVRCGGRYLPVLVRRSDAPGGSGGGSAGGQAALRFRVELQAAGLGPGLLQVDLRLGGRPQCALPALLLPPGREELAAELGVVTEAWAGAWQQQGSEEARRDAIGELLYDLAAVMYSTADEHACGFEALAAHLLAYADGNGLAALAAAVREAAAARALIPPAAGAAALSAVGCRPRPSIGAGTSSNSSDPPRPPLPLPGQGVWSEVRAALLLSAGLAREGAEEAEAFRAVAATWTAAQAHTIQALELAAALALLRGLSDPRVGTLFLWVLRLAASATTAIAWPLLPPARWRRLAVAARVPRYAASLVCKATTLKLQLGLQPKLASFYPGWGMLFAEGLLLPVTCPLSLPAALALSALRLPLNAALMSLGLGGGGRMSGGSSGLARLLLSGRGLLLAARVEAVALAATLACHVYLRLMCWRARRRLEAQQLRQRHARKGGKEE